MTGITKLLRNGTHGKNITWIRSVRTNRTQRVLLNRVSSEDVKVLSGVSQGTVLGPSLFLLYINDLPVSLSSNVRLFADYTTQVQTPS